MDKSFDAYDAGVASFEDTSRQTVESQFNSWKEEHPRDVIVDMHYNVGLSPYGEGEIFRIYAITIAFAKR